nr:hypothetical protein [uncultured Sphaerochaeta sp.]
MRKMLVVLGVLMLVFSLVGCSGSPSLYFSETPQITMTPNVVDVDGTETERFFISSIEEVNPSTRDLPTDSDEDPFELWVMPTRRGYNEVIRHENAQNIKRFVVQNTDEYTIPIDEFPVNDPSVVFIMRQTDGGEYEVVGFLSLQIDEDTAVLEFPPSSEMNGEIAFGTVTVSENSYIASSTQTLANNSNCFSNDTYLELQQDAMAQNLVLMAINVLWNTHSSHYYAPALMFTYNMNETNSIDWGVLELLVYSNDYSSKAALFDPQGRMLGESQAYRLGYGQQSSVQWSDQIDIETFFSSANKGALWGLIDEDAGQLAAFDFSMTIVKDDEGNPIIPCIDPTYVVKEDDPSLVDRIDMNWFYYDLDGTTKHPITSGSPIASLIEETSLYMDIHTEEDNGTYMIRSRGSGGAFGMEGDIFSLTNFDRELAVSELGDLSIGYRFTFYNCNTQWED